MHGSMHTQRGGGVFIKLNSELKISSFKPTFGNLLAKNDSVLEVGTWKPQTHIGTGYSKLNCLIISYCKLFNLVIFIVQLVELYMNQNLSDYLI